MTTKPAVHMPASEATELGADPIQSPDLFIDGVPQKLIRVLGDGVACFEPREMEIAPRTPSMYWREGC